MNRSLALTLAVLACAGSAAQGEDLSRVLGSIDVQPGEHAGDVSTVNGSVRIGEHAVIGSASTVNGSIQVERNVTAVSLTTINGAVQLAGGDRIAGSIHTVNGSLDIEPGGDVAGNLTNVNGSILIRSAHVGGRIDTVTGDIDIGPASHIDGDVIVEPDTSWFHLYVRVPRIVIEPGSVVKGTLRFKRQVQLFVSDRAQIGPVVGATVQRFAGDQPPQ